LDNKKLNFEKELVIKSSTDNLSLIRDFVRQSAEDAKISSEVTGKIILAVDEACTNVVKHAYKYSPDGEISIKVKVKDSKFTITIIDEGDYFNPNLIPEPDIKEYHKQRRIGGLGMFLMKKLMDEVNYTTLPPKKNKVVMVKYI
jgi:serine/threonine-protein kinase RsbW